MYAHTLQPDTDLKKHKVQPQGAYLVSKTTCPRQMTFVPAP